MRQSRRTNTGNRRDTLARRWRPWLPSDAVSGPDDPTVGAELPVLADESDLLADRSTLGEAADTEPARQ